MTVIEQVISTLIEEIKLTKNIEQIRKTNDAIIHMRKIQNNDANGKTETVELIQNPLDRPGPIHQEVKLPSS